MSALLVASALSTSKWAFNVQASGLLSFVEHALAVLIACCKEGNVLGYVDELCVSANNPI